MVDEEEEFPAIFDKFCSWLKHDLQLVHPNLMDYDTEEQPKFAFVTCGDWDLKYMLPSQCDTSQITLPHYFTKWINVKKAFAMSCGPTGIGSFPRSLSEMLRNLGLYFEGRPHSGIDDVKNIVKVVQKLGKERCHIFENTSSITN